MCSSRVRKKPSCASSMYSSSDMSRISSSFNCTPTARTTRLLGARGFGGGGACFGVAAGFTGDFATAAVRSEEHTSELQSLMRISYAVFCLKKKKQKKTKEQPEIKSHSQKESRQHE